MQQAMKREERKEEGRRWRKLINIIAAGLGNIHFMQRRHKRGGLWKCRGGTRGGERAQMRGKRRGRGDGKKMQISVAPVNKRLCVNQQMKWHI